METKTQGVAPRAQVTTGDTPPDIESICHWDSHKYCGDRETSDAFFMEVADLRKTNGQLMVCVAPESGEIDDVMSVALEIGHIPGSKTDVQSMHVAFAPERMAFTVFKQGDSFILRPEVGVGLVPTVLPDGTHAFIVQ